MPMGGGGGGGMPKPSSGMPKRSPAARPVMATRPVARAMGGDGGRGAQNGMSADHRAQIDDLQAQVMEMKLTVEGLEKERDFYFGKLRDVEVLCQEHELTGGPVVRKVLDILYATEEGFAVPEEDDVPPPPEEEY